MSYDINNYNIFEKIGRGGFGTVYRGQVKSSEENVAIKFVDKRIYSNNPRLKERILTEIRVQNKLKHRNVCELYCCFEDENYIYLVLELCAKGDLHHFLKEQTLNEQEAKDIFIQVLDGLRYLHSHGIMHRDISAKNILLSANLEVKICDFGLAEEPQNKVLKTICGTPAAIAPEVIGVKGYSFEADIWSLGTLLYQLLVGRPPFEGDSAISTLRKSCTTSVDIPKHLSYKAKDLITGMLNPNPLGRLKLNQVFSHPFITSEQISPSRSVDSGIDSGILRTRSSKYTPNLSPLKSSADLTSVSKVFQLDEDRKFQRSMISSILSRNRSHIASEIVSDIENVPIISTARLPAIRQVLRNYILHITIDGEAGVEFLKQDDDNTTVSLVFKTSQDGQQLTVFKPKHKYKPSDHFPSLDNGQCHFYKLPNLPKTLRKKYEVMVRFVNAMRMSVSKVTLCTERGVARLMENPQSFTVEYHDGWLLTRKNDMTRLLNPKDSNYQIQIPSEQQLRNYSVDIQERYEYAMKCIEHCRKIEGQLEGLHGDDFAVFPVRVGASGKA